MIIKLIMLWSLTFAGQNWQRLVEARDTSQLIEADQRYQSMSFLDQQCRAEKGGKHFPKNCLIYIDKKLENELSIAETKSLIGESDRLCAKNADNIENLPMIKRLLELKTLLPNCREKLMRRLGDVIYSKT